MSDTMKNTRLYNFIKVHGLSKNGKEKMLEHSRNYIKTT